MKDGELPLGPQQRLEAEFDPRLADVWLAIFQSTDGGEGQNLHEHLAWFLRMAYLRGYEDALAEPVRGILHKRLGLRPPDRETVQPATQTKRKRRAR